MTDAITTQRMVQELIEKEPTPLEIVLRPLTALQLAGLVQLALRHPSVSADLRESAERFLTGVRAYFADSPTVFAVVCRGDDPSEDRR